MIEWKVRILKIILSLQNIISQKYSLCLFFKNIFSHFQAHSFSFNFSFIVDNWKIFLGTDSTLATKHSCLITLETDDLVFGYITLILSKGLSTSIEIIFYSSLGYSTCWIIWKSKSIITSNKSEMTAFFNIEICNLGRI